MQIFFEPKVYLIARPSIDWASINDALRDEYDDANWQYQGKSHGELLCEFAGRVCYGSFGEKQGRKNSAEYLKNILASGHGSVLEHATYSFLVCRASRYYTHEQVRHRAGFAYSQESTRYCVYDEKGARVCLPGMKDAPPDMVIHTGEHIQAGLRLYEKMLKGLQRDFEFGEAKRSKRKAVCTAIRAALPSSMESKIIFSANVRALRHFIELRGSEAAAPEMRMVAEQVLRLMRGECPTLFDDFVIAEGSDGFPMTLNQFRKV
jgi:thymidylate synthase (FAD)